ncbi:MAG: hypothetical protein Pg6A_08290 [Termitinemataceae bacterium]|nr:MAG: hypothetical protein Pg6A_08290 [Termitinemataceae bacterium]
MNTKAYVDSLFCGYEEDAGLTDFKEELVSNLNEKIAALTKGGMDQDAAFKKASAQLGDISALADEISLKKKKEIIGEAFMEDIKHYMTPRRVVAYVIFGIIALFGFICAAIAAFGGEAGGFNFSLHTGSMTFNTTPNSFVPFLGTLLAFIPVSAAGFTWLGLTQELPGLYPLSAKRAIWYAAAALVLCFGVILFPLTWFSTSGETGLTGALGILIPFVLPPLGLIIYLALTEKDRRKPWLREYVTEVSRRYVQRYTHNYGFDFDNLQDASRFGIFSGALWIFSIGVFLVLGFSSIGFKYAWIVFVFTIALQLLIQAALMKKPQQN